MGQILLLNSSSKHFKTRYLKEDIYSLRYLDIPEIQMIQSTPFLSFLFCFLSMKKYSHFYNIWAFQHIMSIKLMGKSQDATKCHLLSIALLHLWFKLICVQVDLSPPFSYNNKGKLGDWFILQFSVQDKFTGHIFNTYWGTVFFFFFLIYAEYLYRSEHMQILHYPSEASGSWEFVTNFTTAHFNHCAVFLEIFILVCIAIFFFDNNLNAT